MSLIKVSSNKFERAKEYIFTHGRPLERARFQFEFENGSKDHVLHHIKPYQNSDGGFGHGIEPDFWLPQSSPMATWAAGQILMEIHADRSEPIVQLVISYLTNTLNRETGLWQSILPENNDYPHAPWWHWKEGIQQNWMFNPSAELGAFLIHWSDDHSEAKEAGWDALRHAVNHVMTVTEMDRHEVNNYRQLVNILRPYESEFKEKLEFWSYVKKSDKLNVVFPSLTY